MRTHVSFRFPAEFVPFSDEDGILAVEGAQWFVELLKRVPDLEVESELCQEDWGVVAFARRTNSKFWIGLSGWMDGEGSWLLHIHHGSFAWLQRFSRTGQVELDRLTRDVHSVLSEGHEISDIVWYSEKDVLQAVPKGFAEP